MWLQNPRLVPWSPWIYFLRRRLTFLYLLYALYPVKKTIVTIERITSAHPPSPPGCSSPPPGAPGSSRLAPIRILRSQHQCTNMTESCSRIGFIVTKTCMNWHKFKRRNNIENKYNQLNEQILFCVLLDPFTVESDHVELAVALSLNFEEFSLECVWMCQIL